MALKSSEYNAISFYNLPSEIATMTRMSFEKKFPWLSIGLLLFAYCNMGWVLQASAAPWWLWLAIAVSLLIVIEILAFPVSLFRHLFSKWISSDTKAFFAAILLAFLSVVFLTWIHISAVALLLVTAATLARLDLQAAAISEFKAFFILSVFSFSGLGLGALANWGIQHFDWLVKYWNQIF